MSGVLILKNIEHEGPGTIEEHLMKLNIAYSIVNMQTQLCPDSAEYDTLVIMGGPMSVNDSKDYPYLTDEIEIIREFINDRKKILGICLGAQLIAKALSTDVYKGKGKEIGWYTLDVTQDGRNDNLFSTLINPDNKTLTLFHWHGETFDIPAGAVRLASSELFPNQGFRYGNNVYAFQYHIEVTPEIINLWMKDEPIDHKAMQDETNRLFPAYIQRAKNFYSGFFV
jgi:GMP synthase-like glutamine amidotransferase